MPRFQKSGTCSVCAGQIWFYPAPVPTEDDPDGEQGDWTHLHAADWVDAPHPAQPAA